MTKKKVFFIGTLSSGGGERVISILSSRMAQDGIPVEILTYYNCEPFYKIDEKVTHISVCQATKSKNILRNVLWMRRYFKKNADVVISFLAPFNMLAVVSMFFTRIPLIVADRNDPNCVPSSLLLRKIRNILYRFADGVVLQTNKNRDYFPKKIKDKSAVIYNPVNIGEKSGAALLAEKKDRIVSVGRLMLQKNQKMLIEAFAIIHNDFKGYSLTIYGEGQCRESLVRLSSDLGMADCVGFPGSVKDLHDRILDAKLFVLSSDYEGMPNALIEAMCLGLPVISTSVSGASDLIKDGENGLLVPVRDTEKLAEAMKRMLSDDILRQKCGESAVELNKRLDVETVTAEWMNFINLVYSRTQNKNVR